MRVLQPCNVKNTLILFKFKTREVVLLHSLLAILHYLQESMIGIKLTLVFVAVMFWFQKVTREYQFVVCLESLDSAFMALGLLLFLQQNLQHQLKLQAQKWEILSSVLTISVSWMQVTLMWSKLPMEVNCKFTFYLVIVCIFFFNINRPAIVLVSSTKN